MPLSFPPSMFAVPPGAPRARLVEEATGLRPQSFPISPRGRVLVHPRAGAVPGTLALPRRCREGGTGVSPVKETGVETSPMRGHNSSKDMALAWIFYQGQRVSMRRRHGGEVVEWVGDPIRERLGVAKVERHAVAGDGIVEAGERLGICRFGGREEPEAFPARAG